MNPPPATPTTDRASNCAANSGILPPVPLLFRSAPALEYSIIDFDADLRDPSNIADWVAAWLTSPEMTELFGLFDHRLTSSGLRDLLREAEEITREIFDFRQGGERWEARKTEFAPRVTEVAEALVAKIFREPTEAGPRIDIGPVDHALVLGGRINSCVLRAELLAKLISEELPVGTVWGLGSRRQVIEDERAVARQLGAGRIDDELDAMAAALRYSMRLPHDGADIGTTEPSEVRSIASEPVRVIGLAAAPGDGKPRATTSDTYRFFREAAAVEEGQHLLIVTSAIHAPFQHAQAIAELGISTSATITSVGAHIGTSPLPVVRHEWTTAEWLQEIRSAIWSMRTMYEALVERFPELETAERTTR